MRSIIRSIIQRILIKKKGGVREVARTPNGVNNGWCSGELFSVRFRALLHMNFRILLYNIKSFNIFQSTQFNHDLQIECVSKPANSQLIELIESWHSIQYWSLVATLLGDRASWMLVGAGRSYELGDRASWAIVQAGRSCEQSDRASRVIWPSALY